MAKLMFALWGADPGEALNCADTRSALKQAGAHRLQVNSGGHVEFADAMRLSTSAPPIDAIVSVWTDHPAEAIVSVLTDLADRVVGWEVTERRPLEPPPVPDGEPADAMANVAFLRRPADLNRAEWMTRWLDEHTPIASATQATFGYVQNVVERPVTPAVEPVDAIVEELFPTSAAGDVHSFYGSKGNDDELTSRMTAMLESVVRIGAHENIDLVPTRRTLHELRADA